MRPETLLRLYPRSWRERYGDEFIALLEKEGTGLRIVLNVFTGAFLVPSSAFAVHTLVHVLVYRWLGYEA